MLILGPMPVAGVQDATLFHVAPVTPVAPVAAAASGTDAGQTRSDTGERGQNVPKPEFPRPDPNRPAGPPPAFDVTPLQLQAERWQIPEARMGGTAGTETPESETTTPEQRDAERRQSEAAQFWGSAELAPVAQRQVDIEV